MKNIQSLSGGYTHNAQRAAREHDFNIISRAIVVRMSVELRDNIYVVRRCTSASRAGIRKEVQVHYGALNVLCNIEDMTDLPGRFDLSNYQVSDIEKQQIFDIALREKNLRILKLFANPLEQFCNRRCGTRDNRSMVHYLANLDLTADRYNTSEVDPLPIIEYLLQNARNRVDETGYSYFHGACQAGLVQAVERYIAAGVNVDLDTYECPPLHLAAQHRHERVVELLLGHGADPRGLDRREGSTPLHALARPSISRSATRSHFCDRRQPAARIVEALLAKGARIEARNRHGDTPLQSAVSRFDVELVRALLARGASLDNLNEDRMFGADFSVPELKNYALTLNIVETMRALQSAGYRMTFRTRLWIIKCWMRVRGNDTDHLLADYLDGENFHLSIYTCEFNIFIHKQLGLYLRQDAMHHLNEMCNRMKRIAKEEERDSFPAPEVSELFLERDILDKIKLTEKVSLLDLCRMNYAQGRAVLKRLEDWRVPDLHELPFLKLIVKRHLANVLIRPQLVLFAADFLERFLKLPYTVCRKIAEYSSDEDILRWSELTNEEYLAVESTPIEDQIQETNQKDLAVESTPIEDQIQETNQEDQVSPPILQRSERLRVQNQKRRKDEQNLVEQSLAVIPTYERAQIVHLPQKLCRNSGYILRAREGLGAIRLSSISVCAELTSLCTAILYQSDLRARVGEMRIAIPYTQKRLKPACCYPRRSGRVVLKRLENWRVPDICTRYPILEDDRQEARADEAAVGAVRGRLSVDASKSASRRNDDDDGIGSGAENGAAARGRCSCRVTMRSCAPQDDERDIDTISRPGTKKKYLRYTGRVSKTQYRESPRDFYSNYSPSDREQTSLIRYPRSACFTPRAFFTRRVPAIGRLSRKMRAHVARLCPRGESFYFIVRRVPCYAQRAKYIFIIIARRRRRFTSGQAESRRLGVAVSVSRRGRDLRLGVHRVEHGGSRAVAIQARVALVLGQLAVSERPGPLRRRMLRLRRRYLLAVAVVVVVLQRGQTSGVLASLKEKRGQ
ncbi:unnamed protein product [Trichogramma brassicae]|uniref:Uncharacterized protein n=1 Tax=Trichogramma brassicae TaxID=86971 RepID=A0A6H5ICQ6_9HYME|nr:unnamed protein product [Trichogramma brassicae]